MNRTLRIGERRVELRPVRPGDEEFLFRVYSASRASEMALSSLDPARQEGFLRHQYAAQRKAYETKDPEARHSLITVDGKKAGRIWVAPRAEEIRLLDVALLPEFAKQGIRKALLHEWQAEAERKGHPLQVALIKDRKGLHRYFEALGFRKLEEQDTRFLFTWSPRRDEVPQPSDGPDRTGPEKGSTRLIVLLGATVAATVLFLLIALFHSHREVADALIETTPKLDSLTEDSSHRPLSPPAPTPAAQVGLKDLESIESTDSSDSRIFLPPPKLRGSAKASMITRDGETGDPIPDLAFVVFSERPGRLRFGFGKTDEQGRAALDHLPPRLLLVETERRPPFASTLAAISLEAETSGELLVSVSRGGEVEGKVVDDRMHPLSGVKILLATTPPGPSGRAEKKSLPPEFRERPVAETGEDGTYRVPAIQSHPRGVWVVDGKIRPERWEFPRLKFVSGDLERIVTVHVVAGEAKRLDDVVFPRPRIYLGILIDADGTKVPGALLSLNRDRFSYQEELGQADVDSTARIGMDSPDFEVFANETYTTETGAFQIESTERREKILALTPNGQSQVFPLPELDAGESIEGVVLQLRRATLLDLVLLDSEGLRISEDRLLKARKAKRRAGGRAWTVGADRPLVKAVLRDGSTQTAKCKGTSDGAFRLEFSAPPEEIRTLIVEAPDYQPAIKSLPRGADPDRPIEVELKSTPYYQLQLAFSFDPLEESLKNRRKSPTLLKVSIGLAPPRKNDSSLRNDPSQMQAQVDVAKNSRLNFSHPNEGPFWVSVRSHYDRSDEKTLRLGQLPTGDQVHEIALGDISHLLPKHYWKKDPRNKRPPDEAAEPGVRGKLVIAVLDRETGNPVPSAFIEIDPETPGAKRVSLTRQQYGQSLRGSIEVGAWSGVIMALGYEPGPRIDFYASKENQTDLGTYELRPIEKRIVHFVQADGTPVPAGSKVAFLDAPRPRQKQILTSRSAIIDEFSRIEFSPHDRIGPLQVRVGQRDRLNAWTTKSQFAEIPPAEGKEVPTVRLAPWRTIELLITGIPPTHQHTHGSLRVTQKDSEGDSKLLLHLSNDLFRGEDGSRTLRFSVAEGAYRATYRIGRVQGQTRFSATATNEPQRFTLRMSEKRKQ